MRERKFLIIVGALVVCAPAHSAAEKHRIGLRQETTSSKTKLPSASIEDRAMSDWIKIFRGAANVDPTDVAVPKSSVISKVQQALQNAADGAKLAEDLDTYSIFTLLLSGLPTSWFKSLYGKAFTFNPEKATTVLQRVFAEVGKLPSRSEDVDIQSALLFTTTQVSISLAKTLVGKYASFIPHLATLMDRSFGNPTAPAIEKLAKDVGKFALMDAGSWVLSKFINPLTEKKLWISYGSTTAGTSRGGHFSIDMQQGRVKISMNALDETLIPNAGINTNRARAPRLRLNQPTSVARPDPTINRLGSATVNFDHVEPNVNPAKVSLDPVGPMDHPAKLSFDPVELNADSAKISLDAPSPNLAFIDSKPNLDPIKISLDPVATRSEPVATRSDPDAIKLDPFKTTIDQAKRNMSKKQARLVQKYGMHFFIVAVLLAMISVFIAGMAIQQ
ncbi:hypothetical protein CCR75_003813 [Bremia lactucae]|uniref:Uncharacterized protein n=1 Tax=Bremia lactucae TaxID=4779 RepID=A0A976FJR5_BRELC|nr:hypothetical protein CCR75_003813 [Bremia lactucae]